MVARGGGRGQHGRGIDRYRRGPQVPPLRRDTRVCYNFQNKGRCNHGDSCKFSHNIIDMSADKRLKNPEETPEQHQAKRSYHSWKRLLGEEAGDPSIMYRLWKGSLAILNDGDRDWLQQLPQDLDKDDENHQGRLHIRAILNSKVRGSDYITFNTNFQNFLLTITHPALVRSLATETYVGSIYNCFSGVNGNSALPFLRRGCKTLAAAHSEDQHLGSPEEIGCMIYTIALALHELLQRERRVLFHDDLPVLIQLIQQTGSTVGREVSADYSQRIADRLNNIQAMTDRAQLLLAQNSSEGDSSDSAEDNFSYPRELITPSNRHDNDKMDIADITIFPTRDEIMSDVKEFLPYTDRDQPHFLLGPVQRHIDTHFRLFRHDVFGDLKAGLAALMYAAAEDETVLSNPRISLPDIRAYPYTNAYISYMNYDSRKGLRIQIAFLQPSNLRQMDFLKRQQWWEESRRFDEGSVLSFIWVDGFGSQHVFLNVCEKATNSAKEYGLATKGRIAFITANLETHDRSNLKLIQQAYSTKANGILLEFPKLMPATFVPVLENLKVMQRVNRLPFQEWILPAQYDQTANSRRTVDVPPPLYARTAGFNFPLKSLVTNGDDFHIEPSASCDDEALLQRLDSATQLDRGQCRALVAALTREFAFIQGPPGTGKSYLGLQLMKILLSVRTKANLGPILVVTYTNHALDQFLEHLLDTGVKKIVRVGGQSRSGKLADHNLRNVRQSESRTKAEGYLAAMNYKKMDSLTKDANSTLAALRAMNKPGNWSSLWPYIQEEYPSISSQFREVDDDGFRIVGRHPFDVWLTTHESNDEHVGADNMLHGGISMEGLIREANRNVHNLTIQERRALTSYWATQAQKEKAGELVGIIDDAGKIRDTLRNIHEEGNRRILQDAEVIGVTTSGLAKRIAVFQHVKCKVMVCEEAGEVMEPHILSAFLPDIEHCIQIGDHEQLRPSVNNFQDLSLESERGKLHQLDRSQFERLAVGEPGRQRMPVAQLNVQRRMRPEISSLIQQTIYDHLVDHPSTTDMPSVVGMRQNLFWLDHNNFEDQSMDIDHSKSKSNTWEVEMVHSLVRHIVRQGIYQSEDIAVLTPYTGQLQKLRTSMRKSFEIVVSDRDQDALEQDGFTDESQPNQNNLKDTQPHRKQALEKKSFIDLLRVATVDNFQGEEAKIIIVSLVRSNAKQSVGFLKTTNRINVLLSRAKHGMYLIGNTDTYSNVDMWQKVINMLRAEDAVGENLALCCPRHTGTIIQVRQPDDFLKLSPEGGCREACADRLDCGHRCQARCHSAAMHAVFQCEQPCQHQHQPCNHACQKPTCGEPCGDCKILLDDVLLPCGHYKNRVECHKTFDSGRISCGVKVNKHVTGCNHDVIVSCSQDVTAEGFRCPTPCSTPLPCGHVCPGSCGRCKVTDELGQSIVKHVLCNKVCGRKMGTCSHNCVRNCHKGTDCGLCQKSCEVRCKHNKCPQKCHEPCAPCVEPCAWSCEHRGGCTMPCSAPCNRLPCDERCTKLLRCGHQCPGLCGEVCAVDYCQECGMKSDAQPDIIMMTSYADVDLNEFPIVVLGCGHFFTVETLDRLVGLKDVYELDPMTGQYVGLIVNHELAATIPQCPNCRSPIKQYVTQRYNRLINRAVIDEMCKRFIVSGQQELQSHEDALKDMTANLEASRDRLATPQNISVSNSDGANRFIAKVNKKLKSRYHEATQLTNKILAVQKRVSDQHQPARRLHMATVHAVNNDLTLDDALANMVIESSATAANWSRDLRILLGARLLALKSKYTILEDNFDISRLLRSNAPAYTAEVGFSSGSPIKRSKKFFQECAMLIDDAVDGSLPKIAVEAILYYARLVQLLGSSTFASDNDRAKAAERRKDAQTLLGQAEELCQHSFRDRDKLCEAVAKLSNMLRGPFYEKLTKEEIEAVKRAMVSGHGGISTHSGHWYNCENGHPFAIGECGMPMQLASCPECGAAVGGQSHQAVAGVTRATEMED